MRFKNPFERLFDKTKSTSDFDHDMDYAPDWDSLTKLSDGRSPDITFDDLAKEPFAGVAGSTVSAVDLGPHSEVATPSPEHHPVFDTLESEKPASSPEVQALKDFFKADLRIKRALMDAAPEAADYYDEDSRMKYVDSAYHNFKDLRAEFAPITEHYGFEREVNDFFQRGEEDFALSHYDSDGIKHLYQDKFSNLRPDFVEKVKQNTVGYKLLNDIHSVFPKAQTANELLHAYHSYIMNNEYILQRVPAIAEKENTNGETITLRGDESELSRQVFDAIPDDFSIGPTEIIAAGDHVMMMVRDRGHALTLSAEPDQDKTDQMWLEYNIPKLCNVDMIKALPGLAGYTNFGARGGFFIPRADFGTKVVDFIAQVPTDLDASGVRERISQQNRV